jgi:DUF971 family protein
VNKDANYIPADLNVSLSKGLTITWADGRKSSYSCHFLRSHSPCATERELRKRLVEEGNEQAYNVDRNVTIVTAKEVGNYALHFSFSDRHSKYSRFQQGSAYLLF